MPRYSRPRRPRRPRRNNSYWIQGAIKEPGSLRKYAKGKKGAFTKKGTLSIKWLKKIAYDPFIDKRTRRRAQLAITLRKLSKKKHNRRFSKKISRRCFG